MNYIYPENLKAKPTMWFWSLKDFVILGIGVLISIVFLIHLHKIVPAAIVLTYGFLTIRLDDATILDFIKYAVRYFITTQQDYRWR
ncbi:hypothetical protein SAMN05216413_2611 [Ruminococcaceae bacterium KH2T8]|nr:hypothetical protein SAMN05216413_2611 [Ruminococcaceae bacterium KH2T8]